MPDIQAEDTLYVKYGGIETVSKIVHRFYEKIKASEPLTPYFAQVDMENLIHHQIQLFSSIMGGPVYYEGQQLEAAHCSLNITLVIVKQK